MGDEKYVYYQDLREKKTTGYSARKQRTHCGKGGRVKFPSDYLTKKEIKNMSGEVKSYRLNEPMTYAEFRLMPEDLQKTYIMALRQKYNAPVAAIGNLMGVERAHLSKYLREVLGFENFPHGNHRWDNEGFMEWAYGIPKAEEVAAEEVEQTVEVEQEVIEEETAVAEECSYKQIPNPGIKVNLFNAEEELKKGYEIKFKKVIPTTGSMTYEGMTFDILSSISDLLGNTKVLLSVKWDVVED